VIKSAKVVLAVAAVMIGTVLLAMGGKLFAKTMTFPHLAPRFSGKVRSSSHGRVGPTGLSPSSARSRAPNDPAQISDPRRGARS
jgi:hypothetical protein